MPGADDYKTTACTVNARLENLPAIFVLQTVSVMLSEALQRNVKHEAGLSNLSGSLRVPRTTNESLKAWPRGLSSATLQLRFAQNETAYGSDHSKFISPSCLVPPRRADT